MRFLSRTLALGLIVVAGTAAAQEAANPVVRDRIAAMQTIRISTGTLGNMASGRATFDAAAATAAKADLAAAAAALPALFEAPEADPVSKASARIWSDFAGFSAQAEALVTAAEALDVSSLEGVKAGMGVVGGTCRECHQAYRN